MRDSGETQYFGLREKNRGQAILLLVSCALTRCAVSQANLSALDRENVFLVDELSRQWPTTRKDSQDGVLAQSHRPNTPAVGALGDKHPPVAEHDSPGGRWCHRPECESTWRLPLP